LRTEGSFLLHRFSSDQEYSKWKAQVLFSGMEEIFAAQADFQPDMQNLSITMPRKVDDVDIAFIRSQRNTPALFGAGLIDRIPDRVLDEVAAEQQKAAAAATKGQPVVSRNSTDVSMQPGLQEIALPLAGRVARLKD